MSKILGYTFLISLFILVALGFLFGKKIYRLYKVKHLFNDDQITYNFTNISKIFPVNKIKKSASPFIFKEGSKIKLPSTFTYKNKLENTQEFLDYISNTGFIVIQNDQILFESYQNGQTINSHHISWSVAKSYTSALFGIAIEEGHIKSIEEKITDYVPELKGTGYDNVRIKDVLQMSSGVKFDEDYGNYESDINRMGRAIAFGSSLDEFAASLTRDKEPGTTLYYVSIDTHVLGMVIRKATGKKMHEYLEEKIWKKIGTESDAFYLADDYGVSFVLGGLNATLRDYARFGRLFLNDGNWNGEQIVPKAWVRESVTPDAPHLLPGYNNPKSESPFGYGYQWWIPIVPDGDFFASGIYTQSIYINQKKNCIIAINSSNTNFNDDGSVAKEKLIVLFQKIARQLD